MLQQYYSELGEKARYETTARYNAFIKKWHVRTKQELKGRGIKFFEVAQDGTGRNVYLVTPNAFKKLCEEINISQELLFD